MKKSQLRNIIRESIKQLMTEQTQLGKPIRKAFCSSTGILGEAGRFIVDDNGTLRNPQVGDIICYDLDGTEGNFNQIAQQNGCHMEIKGVKTDCDGCPPPIGDGSGNCHFTCLQPPRIVKLLKGCVDGSCCGGTPQGQECLSCSEHRPKYNKNVDKKFDKPTITRRR